MLRQFSEYKDKKILVTGHTGFKGSWLSRLLILAGADVHGLALPAEPHSIYARSGDIGMSSSTYLDICNFNEVDDFISEGKFEGIFHLAAQPLVLKSYESPVETFQTNVMGTVHLLDSIINHNSAKWVVVVTTDKVYKNIEVTFGYTEDNPLGGSDPYSASKSATEMVVNAWRAVAKSKSSKVTLCSARAGNVIGGGDIAQNRLFPDLLRSFYSNIPAVIRNPDSLRPWQHVLDPLNGYLVIGRNLMNQTPIGSAYNFGPGDDSKLTVEDMTIAACSLWEGSPGYVTKSEDSEPTESKLLWLSSEKAIHDLEWTSKLSAYEAIRWTIEWEQLANKRTPVMALDYQIHRFFASHT